ncbi:hypothetical protein [Saccharopolyspora sp. NPDC002376]
MALFAIYALVFQLPNIEDGESLAGFATGALVGLVVAIGGFWLLLRKRR